MTRRIGLTLALLLSGAAAGLATDPTEPTPAPVLVLGERYEAASAAGATAAWEMRLEQSTVVLLTVEQLSVDLTVSVSGGDSNTVLALDSPVDRRGAEIALLELAAGSYRLEIHARELGAPPGRYRLQAARLGDSDPHLPAWRALTRAATGYRQGTAETFAASASDYLRARSLFAELGDAPLEALATYRAAVMLRLTDDSRAALEEASRSLGLWQALANGPRQADAENEIGLDRWAMGETELARAAFDRALELYRRHGERYGEGAALANLCLMDFVAGELRAGLACYDQALPILAEVGAVELEAAGRTSAGRAFEVLGELDRARQSYRRALLMHEAAGNRRGQAQVLNNLGVLQQAGDDPDGALQAFDRSLAIFRELGERRWQARVLNNLGFAYLELGEPRRALGFLARALDGRREVGDRRGEIHSLSNLSQARLQLGEVDTAIELLRLALVEARALGDSRAEGIALFELARATAQEVAGDPKRALELYDQALAKLSSAGERRTEAAALLDRADLLLGLPDPSRAVAGATATKATRDIDRALQIAAEIGDRAAEARGLFLAARLDRNAGRLEQARRRLEDSIEIIEGLRTRISHPQLRATFASVQPRAYELLVDLTMALHARDQRAGHDRTAFEISERGRARGLVELLAEPRPEPSAGWDPELRSRRRLLLERLSTRAERVLDGNKPAVGAIDDHQQAEILRELELVEAEMRRQRPEWSELARPEPLSVASLQALLAAPPTVDDDSATTEPALLLVYGLSETRSYLWAITARTFDSFELPPRRTLESAVRELHRGLADFSPGARRAETSAAAKLSRQLLGPVAGRLTGQRLVIVPDGALHYLPWAAMPLPGEVDTAPPLVESHALSTLPSARVLASLRRDRSQRRTPPKRLAVFADPVFEAVDPRLAEHVEEGSAILAERSAVTVERDGWARLRWTATEARAIAELVPAEQRWLALGAAANRRQLLDDQLRDYAVVHLATHGVLDAETPALSGLMLSLFDATGERQRGFLQLSDIYDLRLAADLVVLSGCRTALGKEIHGEGLVGLTRGFLYAGAARVIASLWRVEDRATAELMERFYTALWQQGLDPPQALRAAQRSIRAERRWRDPYFWAGWVLVGDWQ